MKVLVTGVNGQLGNAVIEELKQREYIFIGIDKDDVDVTDTIAIAAYLERINPDAVVHCAAYTAVDMAEDEADICMNINSYGTENIAKICGKFSIPIMYISTDYVFDGEGERPWSPDDVCFAPLNLYGKSKYAGELAIQKYCSQYYIVRISWAFGFNSNPANQNCNFVNTMIRLGAERGAVQVINDQVGSPTFMPDLAELLVDMLETDKYGIYHATNEGYCTWYDFACEIFRQAGIEVSVIPITSAQYPSKAKRPLNSRMNKDKLASNGFHNLPSWQNALSRYLKEYLPKLGM